ncbi:2-hydroxyacyl-CoA dehydratase family protein [Desulfosarcina sp. OttesenSCG-928-A07]|nr:2-hydroxyacyl-CoA dehydratase family protein [Desulfosarcina sp. OttesenSCG-928-A07]
MESIDKLNAFFEYNPVRVQDAKKAGKKVVGTYCLYSPYEIAIAAGGIPVSLCGTRNDSIPAAESELPRTLCPLIKSSYGFLLNDSCPYLAASDIIIADTTCDGKKKMFELMAQKVGMIILQLPHNQNPEVGLPYWTNQFEILADRLEEEFDTVISEEKLRDAITLMNDERVALKRLMDTTMYIPSPLKGTQLLEVVFKSGFLPDKKTGISLLHEAAEELENLGKQGVSPYSQDTPRILLTGVPVGLGCHKVITLLEECGASLVCLDTCGGYKKTALMVDPGSPPDKKALLAALAERYLSIPCSVMSPNPNRYSTLARLVKEFSADGVLDLTWQGCHTYNVEAFSIKKYVQDQLSLPYLQLETDYSEGDTEQLRVRIEAFLEIVKAGK